MKNQRNNSFIVYNSYLYGKVFIWKYQSSYLHLVTSNGFGISDLAIFCYEH